MAVRRVPTWFNSGQSREIFWSTRKAHFAWAEVAKPTEVGNPTWLGFRMSFIPTAEFSSSSLLTPAGAPTFLPSVMSNHPSNKRTATLKPTTESLTSKMFRRPASRARKARARLRQQNRLRIAVV